MKTKIKIKQRCASVRLVEISGALLNAEQTYVSLSLGKQLVNLLKEVKRTNTPPIP